VLVTLMAFVFCMWNASMQVWPENRWDFVLLCLSMCQWQFHVPALRTVVVSLSITLRCRKSNVDNATQVNVWLQDWRPASNPLWAFGMLLWMLGAAVNIQADYHLLHLRRDCGPGIHLPSEGLFQLVSGANLSGEILEWMGYAIACHRLGAYAFAWFAFCNLAPRALKHADYQNRFGVRLPRARLALIPYVL
jgi:steroid 5-alpha reductase family enzyme